MVILVERPVTTEELQALGLATTSSPTHGDFAVRIDIVGCDPRALAAALATRLLIDDGEGNPHTALLVTADDTVRVTIADGVITGLHAHVDTDDVPDRLVVERQTFTRGDRLRMVLEAAPGLAGDAPPDLQDAEHALVMVLRALVRRTATPADLQIIERATVQLRRVGAEQVSDIVACAADVLAALWDPAAPA